MPDASAEIVDRIEAARRAGEPLNIVGGNSKAFVGREIDARNLEVSMHSGIVQYSPNELVLTARGGSKLAEIEQELEACDQMLGFEPPRFAGHATLGGTLACNFSGPRRPWAGSVRDSVLGIRLITGKGEQLRFGGQVMKNVAGFDVARLQAGALGAFGVISEISVKVLPKPAASVTIVQEMTADDAIARMNELARSPKPLTGAAWTSRRLYLRLAGSFSAVEGTCRQWGGERLEDAASFWTDLREQRLPFFADVAPLWRFSVKSTAPLPMSGDWLIDWAGAQRFVHGDFSHTELTKSASLAGGHVCLYRGGNRDNEVFHALPRPLRELHTRLKAAFDPDRILNPGRLYSWL